MADPAVPSDCRSDPAVPAPGCARRLPWTTVVILLVLAGNLVLCIRRVRDDRGALAFVGLSHLNLLALFYATRRFELSPPGSVAQGRARLAVWLLTTTLTAGFTWKLGTMLPLGLAILAWAMAAATVLVGFHLMFVHGRK